MVIFKALYFFLPAYFANMAPVFAYGIFGTKYSMPIDFGKKFRGRRILGDHKTWRGLFSGIFLAIVVVFVQAYLVRYEFFATLSILDYQSQNEFLLGVLFGLGALLGDAIKSFFKRQKGIKSGEKWPIFDQLDFVAGALLLVSFVYVPEWKYVFVLLIATPALHLLTNIIGYKLKLKEHPW